MGNRRGFIATLATLLALAFAIPAAAADTYPQRPTLEPLRVLDLPTIDRAIVVYIWRSDRPLELRWSTGDSETPPAGTRLRIVLLGESVGTGTGWSELSVQANELTGEHVAGWAWALMGSWVAGVVR